MTGCCIDLADEAATVRFARRLAQLCRPGDVIALSGPLGAGKSVLARALIRARAGDPELVVPSPTFTLVQPYELPGGAVWHVDAYRLAGADEAVELGLDEAFATAITLIEWPENIAGLVPARALRLRLAEGAGEAARRIDVDAPEAWSDRLAALCDADG